MEFTADVYVTLKPTVNDPQGLAIMGALQSMGFAGVHDVRSGKFLLLHLAAADEQVAQQQVDEMCQKLLANPVIESYRFDLAGAEG
jgi:phosphoribosylformylglycinamidine synthase PurS subunit